MRKHNQINPDQLNELNSIFGCVMLLASAQKWKNLTTLTTLSEEAIKFMKVNPQYRYAIAEALDNYLIRQGLMVEATN